MDDYLFGPMTPVARQVIERIKSEYNVSVDYKVTYPGSSLNITFYDPKEELMFKLKYSEYL